MAKKMIFLDFDGVLFNTVKEAYATAMISIDKYENISEIDFSTKEYADFLRYRYLVGPAWNYKYILKFLGEEDFLTQYISAINSAEKSDYEAFESKFFVSRTILRQNNFSTWLNLNEAYPFLHQIKAIIKEESERFKIITTKDKETVVKLLNTEDIAFDHKLIFDQKDFEAFGNKANIIKKIMSDEALSEALFIDDSKKHLDACFKIEHLHLIQADWGYIAPSDREAEKQEDVVKHINKFIGGK